MKARTQLDFFLMSIVFVKKVIFKLQSFEKLFFFERFWKSLYNWDIRTTQQYFLLSFLSKKKKLNISYSLKIKKNKKSSNKWSKFSENLSMSFEDITELEALVGFHKNVSTLIFHFRLFSTSLAGIQGTTIPTFSFTVFMFFLFFSFNVIKPIENHCIVTWIQPL